MKRTKKEFLPYNDYSDRPFDLKWSTAFAIGELQEGINQSREYSMRKYVRMPQQSIHQIDKCLEESMNKNRPIEVQLNSLDEYGRVQPPIIGVFKGLIDLDLINIEGIYIRYNDIRHIIINDFNKWFN